MADEPCENQEQEEDERSIWDDLWDILVALVSFLLTILLGLSIFDWIVSVLRTIFAEDLSWVFALILFISPLVWNLYKKALAIIRRLNDLFRRYRRATRGAN